MICRVYQDGCPKRDVCDPLANCADHRETFAYIPVTPLPPMEWRDVRRQLMRDKPTVRVKAWRVPNEDRPEWGIAFQRAPFSLPARFVADVLPPGDRWWE